MERIFISFRRSDEPYGAILVQTVLAGRFGERNVFRSSDSIPLGDDYAECLDRAIRHCSVVLAVVGPRWLGANDGTGRSRLSDPDDWVYRELAQAFAAGKRVVPVLLGGARLPAPADLPTGITRLARCQYRRIDYRQFKADVAVLGDDLAGLYPELVAGHHRLRTHDGRCHQ